ncbi:MAG: bifunctional 5,10-methylenetetrahydrofolate dehydrogenase/5,10-methenyltetrahydrofolate cyclohydrolase [Thermoplasmatota archaeon]
MTGRIVTGKNIAEDIKNKVKNQVRILKDSKGITPRILSILVGNNPEAQLYLRLRDKGCIDVGISSIRKELSNDISEEELLDVIKESNEDENIHGILIQYPLPVHISMERIMKSIDPDKDVEGLTPSNLGNILIGHELLVPCTPLAVMKILEHEHVDIKGRHVVIVNHSNIVGKPLTALCLNRNATVSTCHVFTKNLSEMTSQADVLISAAGVPGLITQNHVKEGACVIDVAMVQTADGFCGDVVSSEVLKKASFITPVPGGVGPVTVACALSNMVMTSSLCEKERKK